MLKKKRRFSFALRQKPQSQRQLRVSQLINVSLAECFQRESKLSRVLYGMPLTITKVNISADLRIVNCFFLPFNTDFSKEDILAALFDSRYIIRDYITQKVNLKYSPEIRFHYDEDFETSQKIEELLKKD